MASIVKYQPNSLREESDTARVSPVLNARPNIEDRAATYIIG